MTTAFTLGIVSHGDTWPLGFSIHSQNKGMPIEVVLGVMRQYLTVLEQQYQERIRSELPK